MRARSPEQDVGTAFFSGSPLVFGCTRNRHPSCFIYDTVLSAILDARARDVDEMSRGLDSLMINAPALINNSFRMGARALGASSVLRRPSGPDAWKSPTTARVSPSNLPRARRERKPCRACALRFARCDEDSRDVVLL